MSLTVFFLKKPDSFLEDHIKKLNQLNTYLGYDWKLSKGYYNKSFNTHINIISTSLLANKTIPPISKNWLLKKAKSFKKNPNTFSPAQINFLDSLIPLLGYDWRKPIIKNKELLNSMLNEIKTKCCNGEEIPTRTRKWLNAQRNSYNSKPQSYSSERKEALDKLIPLLGYDWKIPKLKISKESLEERVAKIKKELKIGSEINSTDKNWLERIRRNYRKNNDSISKRDVLKLNELNEFLKFPWNETTVSIRKKQRTFEYLIDEIKSMNVKYTKLPERCVKWILQQRKRYKELQNNFPLEEKVLLDSLIPFIRKRLVKSYYSFV